MTKDIHNILNDKIKVWLPKGYDFCNTCGAYEHHPFVYCNLCGDIFVPEKEMTWREFIKRTAQHGAGPLNTLHYFLTKYLPDTDGEVTTRANGSIYYWDTNADGKKIYAEAHKIFDDNSKEISYWRTHTERFCGICGKILVVPKGHGGSYHYPGKCKDTWEQICEDETKNNGIPRLANQLRGDAKDKRMIK